MAASRVDFQGAFWFPLTPSQLWATAERFDLFQSWWTWLGDFHADAAGLVEGNVLHGMVVPPLPYRLRLDVRLQRCERPQLVEAAVDGDLRGQAVLRLETAGDGTRAAVAWSLEVRSTPLRVAALVAFPLMRRGHDRVLDLAVAGFRQRALSAAASFSRDPGLRLSRPPSLSPAAMSGRTPDPPPAGGRGHARVQDACGPAGDPAAR